jgi:Fe-S-cluster-containing dehydrogenase component/formate-dependent nitrite reductase membrane component NrfD
MNFGFVIDNRSCIGCHACSTACKSENEVPLGVNRTWVKTVEQGVYPDTRRSFQVSRCNHCANPPCVRICPTSAMYQRDDGIVEFDKDSCIGCKSCLQACPYDAIYIDPETKTAAKCHFCSHRVDVGLEPACVVVCPVHAIIAGDLDDPGSEISKLVAAHPTTVRKPEQGTAPKLLYIEGSEIALRPTVFDLPSELQLVDVIEAGPAKERGHLGQELATARSGATIRVPAAQGHSSDGPLQVGQGTRADHMVQLSHNAQHQVPWHWQVPAYLVTKAIGAGSFLFLALGAFLGLFPVTSDALISVGAVGLIATFLTTALLVFDLERPKRFLYILLYPQWKSWLTRGAFLLIGFTLVAGLWWASALSAKLEIWIVPAPASTALLWLTIPLAVGAAIYTAFLFAQAEGRDLWQSALLPPHLVLQALTMGAAAVMVVGFAADLNFELRGVARAIFLIGLALSLFVILVGEIAVPHATDVAAKGAHEMIRGRYKHHFWLGGIALGHILPLALLSLDGPAPLSLAAAGCAMLGLYFYEYAFVMAPQRVPNS